MSNSSLEYLLDQNKAWARGMTQRDPSFFQKLSNQQTPEYLWIGCADSRVPANEIVGLLPGEMFVHRNVANVVPHTDMNLLCVLQYAVEVLKVKHVIVCGHYGCGGVRAALLDNHDHGMLDNWLRLIKDIALDYEDELNLISDPSQRVNRLCELNVERQVGNVCHTAIVQNAWNRGQPLQIHGWIYGVGDGIINDLNMGKTQSREIPQVYRINPPIEK